MATYPASLPPPLQQGYAFRVENTDTALQPVSGTPILFGTSSDQPMVFDVSYTFTRAEAQVFFDWYHNTINAGELPFDVNLLIESGEITQSAVFVADSVDGFDLGVNNRYRVNAQIFVSAPTDPDTGNYDKLVGLAEMSSDSDPETTMNTLDIIVNRKWP